MKWTVIKALSICLLLECLLAPLLPPAEAETGRLKYAARNQDNTRALPAGIRAEDISFSSNGLKFSGRVLLPKAIPGRKSPALLLISGSNLTGPGAVTIAPAPVKGFSDLAALMSANGFVVLTYDAQCSGASECKRDATPQDHAVDGISAFRYLAKRAEVDSSKIIVIGHDEGGGFAASVAANLPQANGKVLGVIVVNMPGRTYGKILRDAAEKRLKTSGKSPEEVRSYLGQFDGLSQSLATSMVDFKTFKADDKDPLFSQIERHRQYLFHLFVNDPLQIVRGVEAPILIVQGAKDSFVSVRDAQYLKEAVDRQYHKDATIEILPEMDHWMREQKTTVTFRDEESDGPLDPAFTTLLNTWISKRLK